MKVPSAEPDHEMKKEVDSVMIGLLDCGLCSVKHLTVRNVLVIIATIMVD